MADATGSSESGMAAHGFHGRHSWNRTPLEQVATGNRYARWRA
jgi:hypothetical protein